MTGLIAGCLPEGIVAAEIHDAGQVVALRDAEAGFVATAGEKRRRDFILGRHCAHLALARLGMTVASLPPGPRGAPLWPAEVVGSITHTAGYAAAIVAPASRFRAVGVDAERVGAVTSALYERLFGAQEQNAISALPPRERLCAATIMFSAKEAYYKASGGIGPLRFRNLRVGLEPGRFRVTPQDGAATGCEGAYAVAGGIAVTVTGLPR